ncbi:enoyl-CoA hydratase/isomerase family protein [Undibacterium terreum]|uniref:3-hydroxyisobutyryl-CoA hydrolase n=1 Tax=Undibacterium terreum TaxID=1224302 RepID=A0A916XHL2_9BURK|nr:enoyl-CoA hydratase/isomerase family protein [Undibacterium terreum]GGC71029.1 enoyl-CoA hydratase [Undibacterium terreum]
MNTTASPVLFETLAAGNGKKLGLATLNAEKTLNALSMDMVELLAQQLTEWRDDASIALVVLQASGEKAFCAGGDLQNLYQSMLEHHASSEKNNVLGNPYALRFFEEEYRLDYLIHTYRKPILCWGHGIVMGGGIGLMAGASHRVVTEKSRLAMPEIAIGLYPDVGGSWFLNRMPGKLGLFLALTGASINASDACFVKLADYQLHHAEKPRLISSLRAQDWSENDEENHKLLSTTLEAAQQHSAFEAGPLRQHFDLINQLCAGARLEDIVAQITGLQSEDAWLQKAVAALTKGSPGSAFIAHALQSGCKHLSLAEVFRLELGVSLACAAGSDFAEGIRALIIDKDMQPRWNPAQLLDIPEDFEQQFFNSPWDAASHPLRDLAACPAPDKRLAA